MNDSPRVKRMDFAVVIWDSQQPFSPFTNVWSWAISVVLCMPPEEGMAKTEKDGVYPEEMKYIHPHKDIQANVHSGIIPNSHKVETTQMFTY